MDYAQMQRRRAYAGFLMGVLAGIIAWITAEIAFSTVSVFLGVTAVMLFIGGVLKISNWYDTI